MATLKEIKNRISGIKNTQKITHAMKIVATTRLKKFERQIRTGSEYLNTLVHCYGELANSAYDFTSSLLAENGAPKKAAIIMLGSDRGLCGSFNSMLFRLTDNFVANDLQGIPCKYITLGMKAEKYYHACGQDVVYSARRVNQNDRAGIINEIVEKTMTLYTKKEVSDVYIIFNGYRSRSDFGFKALHILPFQYIQEELQSPQVEKVKRYYIVEPSLSTCIDSLIPFFFRALIANAMLQSQTTEELSRMMAMDYATENAHELMTDLTLVYNRTRQAVITKEISEIVGGAEALK